MYVFLVYSRLRSHYYVQAVHHFSPAEEQCRHGLAHETSSLYQSSFANGLGRQSRGIEKLDVLQMPIAAITVARMKDVIHTR